VSIYEHFVPTGPSGFGYGSTAEQVSEGISLQGKNILVTGCNSGIGLETARVLSLRGARVLAAARTLEKAQGACSRLTAPSVPLACDLAEPRSVRACVAAVRSSGLQLDAIVCNAGIMALPRLETAYGTELQLFTNHIGHFLLVTSLLSQLADDARVVVLSSDMHRRAPAAGIELDNLDGAKGYSAWRAYGQSKLANLLFAKQLARRFAGTQQTANAVHPGVIVTQLQRHQSPVFSAAMSLFAPLALKSVPQGAATQVYATVSPQLAGVSGQYLSHCNVVEPRADASDPALAEKLWNVSEQLIARLPR
jgi:NAD(P)-dependent dehydrogenase (short-subunit alcohol dehydrogenase family)